LLNTPDVDGYYLWTCDNINNGVGKTASGEIVGGDAKLAWDTTGTSDNNVSCRFSTDASGINRTASSADGDIDIAIDESQKITFTCTDSRNKQQSRDVICSVACDLAKGCLDCSFSPANSPVEPVVGDYVRFSAVIDGGEAPFSVSWIGDDLNYSTSTTWLRNQEFNKIYSTVGPKAVSVRVTDSSVPRNVATCSLLADPSAPNAGPNLRVRGQIREI
jgi:hypothetical protein